jgi:hypothetical protein
MVTGRIGQSLACETRGSSARTTTAIAEKYRLRHDRAARRCALEFDVQAGNAIDPAFMDRRFEKWSVRRIFNLSVTGWRPPFHPLLARAVLASINASFGPFADRRHF